MTDEEKEDLLYVVCDTSSDNQLVRKAYDYINKLENKNKKYWQDKCAKKAFIIELTKTFLKKRIETIPETMTECYEDKRILDKINEFEVLIEGGE